MLCDLTQNGSTPQRSYTQLLVPQLILSQYICPPHRCQHSSTCIQGWLRTQYPFGDLGGGGRAGRWAPQGLTQSCCYNSSVQLRHVLLALLCCCHSLTKVPLHALFQEGQHLRYTCSEGRQQLALVVSLQVIPVLRHLLCHHAQHYAHLQTDKQCWPLVLHVLCQYISVMHVLLCMRTLTSDDGLCKQLCSMPVHACGALCACFDIS